MQKQNIEQITIGDKQYTLYIAPYNIENIDIDKILDISKEIQKDTGVLTQLLDISYIAGKRHVLHSTINALITFENKENLAKHKNLEIMLYVTAQRQIQKAIKLVGISEHTKVAILILQAEDIKRIQQAREKIEHIIGTPDNTLWNINKEIRAQNIITHFEITDEEIQIISEIYNHSEILDTLQEAIMGRIALTKFKTG